MFAETDYSEGTTAYMWICNKINEFAENIKKKEKTKRSGNYSTPTHLVQGKGYEGMAIYKDQEEYYGNYFD